MRCCNHPSRGKGHSGGGEAVMVLTSTAGVEYPLCQQCGRAVLDQPGARRFFRRRRLLQVAA